jgi:hypothetical protein
MNMRAAAHTQYQKIRGALRLNLDSRTEKKDEK